MRMIASFLVALLFSATSSASVHFVQVRITALQELEDRWVLEFENYGISPELDSSTRPVTSRVEFTHEPRCNRNELYSGSKEEYEEALVLLKHQFARGAIVRFGLNAHAVPGDPRKYLATNLKIIGGTVVWAIGPDVGFTLCPFKIAA